MDKKASDNIKRNLNWGGAKKLPYVMVKPDINAHKQKKIKVAAEIAERHYEDVIKNIKASGRTKLSFAAYVIFDSTYGMDGAFKLMMEDKEHWNPKVVVIPDVARGPEHAKQTYVKTKEFFINRYGADYVLDGWDIESDTYFDHLDKFDIVYYANPYDVMAHEYHKIEYASTKNVLPIYVSYGYDVGRYTTLSRLTNPELNLVWKCFADTTYSYQDYKNNQTIKGENVVLAGYSKMDDLSKYTMAMNKRKKVLLTPHHTVSMKDLPLSNFLEYSDLILRLPEMFPKMDFVFRPHPLLFTTLLNNNLWKEQEVDDYLAKLKDLGVEYSSGGDYLSVFAECDAIVNDCGSFTVEWLFTDKPGCFVYNSKLNEKHLTTLMNKSIERYVVAKNEQDIIAFIQGISASGKLQDCKMEKWAKDNIAINYPNVSEFLLKEIDIIN